MLDTLFVLLGLLLHWRVLLTTACGIAVSVAVTKMLPWFSGFQGVALTCLACVAGLLWQATAEQPNYEQPLQDFQPTSASTYAVTAVLLGLFWGAASASNPNSAAAGLLVLPAPIWFWLRFARQAPSLQRTAAPMLCSFSLLFAYLATVTAGLMLG